MKKVFLGMLVVALGFGTMSLTTIKNQEVKVNVVVGPTFTAPWLGSCCESPLSAIDRDLAKRGYPAVTNYTINGTTSNSVTYTVN
jgi:hypothetical protein